MQEQSENQNFSKIKISLLVPWREQVKDEADSTEPEQPCPVVKTFGGDGFVFESTKVSGSKNIVLIFKDDTDANAALNFEEI